MWMFLAVALFCGICAELNMTDACRWVRLPGGLVLHSRPLCLVSLVCFSKVKVAGRCLQNLPAAAVHGSLDRIPTGQPVSELKLLA